jgi:hypothetical protein
MKKNIAEKWIKALRSKRYKQGKGALKYKTRAGTTRHCCLGVLCELYQKEHARKLTTRRSAEQFTDKGWVDIPKGSKFTMFDSHSGDLPAKVMRWAGIKSEDGVIRSTDECLVAINDEGSSFEKIADIIEDRVKEL